MTIDDNYMTIDEHYERDVRARFIKEINRRRVALGKKPTSTTGASD